MFRFAVIPGEPGVLFSCSVSLYLDIRLSLALVVLQGTRCQGGRSKNKHYWHLDIGMVEPKPLVLLSRVSKRETYGTNAQPGADAHSEWTSRIRTTSFV